MSRYAEGTRVSPERSQVEIRDALRRYGANNFGTMEGDDRAAVMFSIGGLTVRIMVELPALSEFKKTAQGRARTNSAARESQEQAVRQRWRALLLAIKAKLEAVECGISTVENEFLAFVVLPDGRTFGQLALPQLQDAAARGRMPALALPEPS